MTRRNTLVFIIILALFAFAICALIYPVFGREQIRLGLDLVGGSHLVYQAQFPDGATGEDKARAMDRALDTIRTRIDKYGVTEPIIQEQEGERILVQLPGFTDIEAAKSLVEQTGFLEFREVELNNGNPVYLGDYLKNANPEFFNKGEAGTRIFVDENGNPIASLDRDEEGNLKYIDEEGNPIDIEELRQIEEQIKAQLEPGSTALLSWITARGDNGTQLTGGFLREARPSITTGITPEPEVAIEWNEEGGIIFDDIAERLHSRPSDSLERCIGIFLDNILISHPQILEPAYHGSGVITGNFTIEEVEHLANLLTSGALPMPLQKPPLYEEMVSATLGADFIDMSIKAGIIGIILIMLFMVIYYRLPGALASLALIFYGTLVLALFKLIPVTLTLAGIGGFVLSIGMAVDANVLIFERMKEELRAGRTLGAAIDTGFSRAWTAIRDSNITTFIVCGILYWLSKNIVASAPVMGFALTLFVGVAVSMFTAIVVTRTLLRLFVGTGLAQRTSLFSVYSGRK
ncbi:MAG TPA: protein translocase subunit SecD [Dehalococcoidia bacterium]|nr:protein translocase subunit SecD [Dehalococcoidia bacterium]